MSTAVITKSPAGVGWHCRFEYDAAAISRMKLMRGRWDPKLRVWKLPTSALTAAVASLEDLGFHVVVEGRRRTETTAPRLVTPEDAVTSFLRLVVPERLRQPVYRALARVLHPDLGGDTTAMQALNRSWERVR